MLTDKTMHTICITFHTDSLKLLSQFCSTSVLDNALFCALHNNLLSTAIL